MDITDRSLTIQSLSDYYSIIWQKSAKSNNDQHLQKIQTSEKRNLIGVNRSDIIVTELMLTK